MTELPPKYLLSSPQFKHALSITFKGYLKCTDVLSTDVLEKNINQAILEFYKEKSIPWFSVRCAVNFLNNSACHNAQYAFTL